MELEDWTVAFVKMRDAMRRTLVEHTTDGDVLTCKHKDRTHHYLLAPKLKVPEATDWYTVVCLQTQENVRFLIDNWNRFQQERLTVLFVNPDENLYWQINPSMHSKIADPDSLAKGIESMAAEIPYVA